MEQLTIVLHHIKNAFRGFATCLSQCLRLTYETRPVESSASISSCLQTEILHQLRSRDITSLAICQALPRTVRRFSNVDNASNGSVGLSISVSACVRDQRGDGFAVVSLSVKFGSDSGLRHSGADKHWYRTFMHRSSSTPTTPYRTVTQSENFQFRAATPILLPEL